MHHTHCLRCGRTLSAARSLAAGYGPGCRARIRAAAATSALVGFTAEQASKALELIADRGLIPAGITGTWTAVSGDGTARYITTRDGCNCRAGQNGRRCYHVAAVLLVRAA